MNFPFRLASLFVFIFFVSACQPRIQPIYAPSSVLMPRGLETAPLSVIRDGILDAGVAKSWKMVELEPGVIRGTLDVANKHEAVVDVVYTNQSFAINYVSSRNLLSQGARIHRSYNTWVRQLETGIYNNLGYIASTQKANPAAAAPAGTAAAAAAATEIVFDPTGFWKVSATYSPTAMSASFCPKQRNWTFELDYRKRGGIDETYWSNGVQLNVIGEHSEDFSDLVFSVPDGGSNWHLTERLKMDRPQVRLTSEPKSSTSSNCVGVVDVIMNKRGGKMAAGVTPAQAPSTAPQKPAPAAPALQKTAPAPAPSAPAKSAPLVAAVPASEAEFTATGTWFVRVNYKPETSNTSWCPKPADWNFTLKLENGKISKTFYTNQRPLYVTGEMDDDYLDLAFDVPVPGSLYEWTERFMLDQPSKQLRAVSEGGHCVGVIDVHMKKQG